MGNDLENKAAKIDVLVQADSTAGTNLNLAMFLTNETPQVVIPNRTKEYFSAAEVATDWSTTSKIYKAAVPHFAQTPHNDRIKVGVQIPKGSVIDDVAVAVVSEVATVTSVAHGLVVGQEITILDSSGSPLINGVKVISDVPTSGTFSFPAPGVADAPTETLDYHIGDATITAALDAIFTQDSNFFQVFSIYKVKADIKEIAAWAQGKNLKYTFSTEDADVKNLISTNVFAELAALNYSKTSGYWHHQSGIDAAGVAISVTDEIATVTEIAHGLRVSDPLTISGATPGGLNGDKTVLTVVDEDNFTFAAAAVIDGAATGTINYFARYVFLEVGIEGYLLGASETATTGIGAASWAYVDKIVGFAATPDSILTPSQALKIIEQYGGNVFKEIDGATVTVGGKNFGGTTIKVQTVADWLDVRLSEASRALLVNQPQLLYTNLDIGKIKNVQQVPINTQLTRGGLTALNEETPFEINYPNAFNVPQADRDDNVLKGTAKVRAGNEILSLELTVNMII